jgi:hypothetical protein
MRFTSSFQYAKRLHARCASSPSRCVPQAPKIEIKILRGPTNSFAMLKLGPEAARRVFLVAFRDTTTALTTFFDAALTVVGVLTVNRMLGSYDVSEAN